jgi:hypothetical protein
MLQHRAWETPRAKGWSKGLLAVNRSIVRRTLALSPVLYLVGLLLKLGWY